MDKLNETEYLDTIFDNIQKEALQYDSDEIDKSQKLNIEKFFDLYKKQVVFDVAGNEWNHANVFHTLLSQLLRDDDGQLINYTKGFKLINPRVHCIIIQGSRSGKGELMKNAIKLFNDCMKVKNFNSLSHYYHTEPTPQHLSGGNEITKKGYKDSYQRKRGILETHSLIAWAEGQALISPSNIYGNFKDLILSVCDDDGTVTQTARKDSTLDGKPTFFKTTCSLITGTVYKETIKSELIQSGLFQRFLVSKKFVDYKTAIEQNKMLMNNLDPDYTLSAGSRLQDFINFYLNLKYPPVIGFEKSAIRYMQKIADSFQNPDTRAYKQEIWNSFFSATIKHIEKIAVLAAACDDSDVQVKHVIYAYTHAIPTFKSYISLVEESFFADYTKVERTRLHIIKEMLLRSHNSELLKTELVTKLVAKKAQGNWDMGVNRTARLIDELIENGSLTCVKGTKSEKIISISR